MTKFGLKKSWNGARENLKVKGRLQGNGGMEKSCAKPRRI